jgi:L-cystine uptake protein TcyP (sodium:dicarboxylate symporter family)
LAIRFVFGVVFIGLSTVPDVGAAALQARLAEAVGVAVAGLRLGLGVAAVPVAVGPAGEAGRVAGAVGVAVLAEVAARAVGERERRQEEQAPPTA